MLRRDKMGDFMLFLLLLFFYIVSGKFFDKLMLCK